MFKKFVFAAALCALPLTSGLYAHCQMPCGIYHDDMVYDQIDQFVETVYKAMSIIDENRFATPKDKNELVRWVVQKEKCCNDAADLLTTYFLQQKIKPGEDDTVKRLVSAHKLLFLMVAIKQNTDLDYVKQFNAEWERFKLMFHREGYECEMEKKEFEQLEKLRKEQAEKAQKETEEPKPSEKSGATHSGK